MQSVRDGLSQVARDREFVLIPEDTCDLLVLEFLLKLVRYMEMLELPLDMFGYAHIELGVSVGYESVIEIDHAEILSLFYSSKIIVT
ncbi:MAG: hypothetical protein IKF09_01680 [Clostridiales bacterium]|nr:hypothetical protein [Clostridiales bacterium]